MAAAACALAGAHALPSAPGGAWGRVAGAARAAGAIPRRGAAAAPAAAPSRIRGGADMDAAMLTVTELVAGSTVVMASTAMNDSSRGALFALIAALLFAVRLINPVAAVSAAARLHSAFRLHEEWRALILCVPLAVLPVAVSKVDASAVPLLAAFFVGSALLVVAAVGMFRDVVMPALTGFDAVPAANPVLKNKAGDEVPMPRPLSFSLEPGQHVTTRAILGAVGGMAAAAVIMRQPTTFILCLAAASVAVLKSLGMQQLECPVAALVVYLSSSALTSARDGATGVHDAGVLRAGTGSVDTGVRAYLSQQVVAVVAALLLKLWAGFRVSESDAVSLALFSSGALTAMVAEYTAEHPRLNLRVSPLAHISPRPNAPVLMCRRFPCALWAQSTHVTCRLAARTRVPLYLPVPDVSGSRPLHQSRVRSLTVWGVASR